jgi:hypothetical protein
MRFGQKRPLRRSPGRPPHHADEGEPAAAPAQVTPDQPVPRAQRSPSPRARGTVLPPAEPASAVEADTTEPGPTMPAAGYYVLSPEQADAAIRRATHLAEN